MSDIHVFIVEDEKAKNNILKMKNGWTYAQIFDADDREEIVKSLDSIQETRA